MQAVKYTSLEAYRESVPQIRKGLYSAVLGYIRAHPHCTCRDIIAYCGESGRKRISELLGDKYIRESGHVKHLVRGKWLPYTTYTVRVVDEADGEQLRMAL